MCPPDGAGTSARAGAVDVLAMSDRHDHGHGGANSLQGERQKVSVQPSRLACVLV